MEETQNIIGIVVIFVIVGAGLYFGGKYFNGAFDTLYYGSEKEEVALEEPKEESKQIKIALSAPSTQPNLEFVSATEYLLGDGSGATIIKLTDHKGDNINTTCWEKILYPDKSTYMDWAVMTQQWEYGNYYMDFAVPETLGIYDQEVRCLVGSKNVSLGKGFHVGNQTQMMQSKVDELKVDYMQAMD